MTPVSNATLRNTNIRIPKTEKKSGPQRTNSLPTTSAEAELPPLANLHVGPPRRSDSLDTGAGRLEEEAPKLGKTIYCNAREALPNTVLDFGYTKPEDPIYDGAFVTSHHHLASQTKIDHSTGNAAFSASTDWHSLDGIRPNNEKTASGKCIYINGMNTSLASQMKSMQNIANATGHEVIGIHNSTHGFVKDVLECAADKLNVGDNGAHKTLTETIYRHVTAHPDQNLDLVAHSQGGIITSRALHDVKEMLKKDGKSSTEASDALKNVRVQTAGAAATTYPSGPKYMHHINNLDPVPQVLAQAMLGPAVNFAKEGPRDRFTQGSNMHSMNQAYAVHLMPFDEMDKKLRGESESSVTYVRQNAS